MKKAQFVLIHQTIPLERPEAWITLVADRLGYGILYARDVLGRARQGLHERASSPERRRAAAEELSQGRNVLVWGLLAAIGERPWALVSHVALRIGGTSKHFPADFLSGTLVEMRSASADAEFARADARAQELAALIAPNVPHISLSYAISDEECAAVLCAALSR